MSAGRSRFAAWLCAVGLLASQPGGATEPPSATSGNGVLPTSRIFVPSRFDYAAFRAGRTALTEPNYLPFMAHRFALDGQARDWLVFCRWDESRFPLSVRVEAPTIAAALRDEKPEHAPQRYVDAVERAVATWEQALAPTLRFRRPAPDESADLTIRLLGDRGPSQGRRAQVLGGTPILNACRIRGGDPARGPFEVEFDVPWLEVYIADPFGLLEPPQVGRIALHELGHALGMRGHSPIPASLMFAETRDRSLDELAPSDVNSFRALYALPNGTVYTSVEPERSSNRRRSEGPSSVPSLDASPHVDRRLGFSFRAPREWQVLEEPHGAVAVDGLAWDYDASFEVLVRGYETVGAYLERNAPFHLGRGTVLGERRAAVAGRTALVVRVLQPREQLVQEHAFLASGDGRVFVLTSEAPRSLYARFEPWFAAILSSFELTARAGL